MCMRVLLACMSVFHLCAWYFRKSEEGIESPGLDIKTDVSCYVGSGNIT